MDETDIYLTLFDDFPPELEVMLKKFSDSQLERCLLQNDPDPILDREYLEEFEPKYNDWFNKRVEFVKKMLKHEPLFDSNQEKEKLYKDKKKL